MKAELKKHCFCYFLENVFINQLSDFFRAINESKQQEDETSN